MEDVLERCFVMSHYAYIRGRPNTPLYNSKMALYVCEHRYKPSTKSFKRVKVWAVCGPEEVRKNDYALKENAGGAVESLAMVPSPFVRGLQGPGGIGNAEEEEDEDQASYHTAAEKGKANAALLNGGLGGMAEIDFSGVSDLPMQNGAVGGQLTPADLAVLSEAFNPLPDGIGQSPLSFSPSPVADTTNDSIAIPHRRKWRLALVHRSAHLSRPPQEASRAFDGLSLLESDGVAEEVDGNEKWSERRRDGLILFDDVIHLPHSSSSLSDAAGLEPNPCEKKKNRIEIEPRETSLTSRFVRILPAWLSQHEA